jgi:hypothetical protein
MPVVTLSFMRTTNGTRAAAASSAAWAAFERLRSCSSKRLIKCAVYEKQQRCGEQTGRQGGERSHVQLEEANR